MVVIKVLIPVLFGQAPAYNKALDWLQFSFMGYSMGDYMAPSSTALYRISLV